MGYFLKSTCDMSTFELLHETWITKGHVTWPFLKFDTRHWGPAINAPHVRWEFLVEDINLFLPWNEKLVFKGLLLTR